MKTSIIQKLREKGLKLTSQRQAILDVLVDKPPAHPSAALIAGWNITVIVRSVERNDLFTLLEQFIRRWRVGIRFL